VYCGDLFIQRLRDLEKTYRELLDDDNLQTRFSEIESTDFTAWRLYAARRPFQSTIRALAMPYVVDSWNIIYSFIAIIMPLLRSLKILKTFTNDWNSLPQQTELEDLTSNVTNFSSLTTFIIRGYPLFAINDVSSVVSTLSFPNGFFWLPDDIHGTVKGLQVRGIECQKMHVDQSVQLFDSLPFLLGTHDPRKKKK
jgi:hypothetical protein